ncbi:MAG: DUF3343 domain-containing protein [Deltaproteobacteria bacterium]|nr:DUF3343 domain-containing protein [Deltaproteobacteria bacterium]
MKEYLATFGSTHKVLKAEKILKEKDIPFRLMPTPKTLSAFCDICVAFQEQDREAVENALQGAGVKAAAIYRKQGDEYVKVQFLRQGK